MTQLTISRIFIISMLLLAGMFLQCQDNPTQVTNGDRDMVGTECKFGLVFAARSEENMVAKAEIIICKEGVETVIASKNFDVNSRTYKKYMDTIEVEDPDCSCNNVLILRISKVSDGSAPLSIRVDGVEPFDSYIEVPKVKIREQR
jgi:hypothetical protein